MNSKMFAACGNFQILTVSLQSLNKPHAKPCCQIWVFSVCFMAASPSRIPKDVDIRTPYCKAFIDIPVSVTALTVIFRPGLISYNACNFFMKIFVKDSSKSDGLRKDCRGSCSGNAVKGFIPPVICRYPQSFDSRRIIFQLGSFFFQGHFSNQFLCFLGGFGSVSH